MSTKPKHTPEFRREVYDLHRSGVISHEIAARFDLTVFAIGSIISHVARVKSGYARKHIRNPSNGYDQGVTKIVLVGDFTPERVADYKARFGEHRLEVRP